MVFLVREAADMTEHERVAEAEVRAHGRPPRRVGTVGRHIDGIVHDAERRFAKHPLPGLSRAGEVVRRRAAQQAPVHGDERTAAAADGMVIARVVRVDDTARDAHFFCQDKRIDVFEAVGVEHDGIVLACMLPEQPAPLHIMAERIPMAGADAVDAAPGVHDLLLEADVVLARDVDEVIADACGVEMAELLHEIRLKTAPVARHADLQDMDHASPAPFISFFIFSYAGRAARQRCRHAGRHGRAGGWPGGRGAASEGRAGLRGHAGG